MKEEWEPKVGEWIIELGSNKLTQVTFYGEHNGFIKLMTPELDRNWPKKEGWAYTYNFRKAEPHEISIQPKTKETNYKYLIPFIIKINKHYGKKVYIT